MEAFGTTRIFDVEVRRDVKPRGLTWPTLAELNDPEATLGGNHLYEDLRWARWSHVRRVIKIETDAIGRIMAAADPAEAADRLDQTYQKTGELHIHPLHGLDLGVASATLALAANRAVPVISCNGGAFGGSHLGLHPYVAFHARKNALGELLAWAGEAGAGLVGRDGLVVLYADRIDPMIAFARIACEAAEGPAALPTRVA